MSREIRLLLVCPSPVIGAGLGLILGNGMRIVESVYDLSTVSPGRISSLRVDAVILDPSAVGTCELSCIRTTYPALKDCIIIAALNMSCSAESLRVFDSYFSINDSASHIVKVISDTVASLKQVSKAEDNGQNILSAREKEILAEVAKGLTNKEIADVLNISIFTVTTHRKNISQKLGIRSIAGLTVYAVMNHIVSEEQLLNL